MNNTGNEGIARLLKTVANDIEDGRKVEHFNYTNDRDGLVLELRVEQTYGDCDE